MKRDPGARKRVLGSRGKTLLAAILRDASLGRDSNQKVSSIPLSASFGFLRYRSLLLRGFVLLVLGLPHKKAERDQNDSDRANEPRPPFGDVRIVGDVREHYTTWVEVVVPDEQRYGCEENDS
jgi:hypothetical protein